MVMPVTLLLVSTGPDAAASPAETVHFLPWAAGVTARVNQLVGKTHTCPGAFCHAVDFDLSGSGVLATATGRLMRVETGAVGQTSKASWGNYVVLEHDDKTCTRYAHLAPGTVTTKRLGDVVSRGEQVGREGNTGSTFPKGPGLGHHLHFQLENCSTGMSLPIDFVEERNQSLVRLEPIMSLNEVAGGPDSDAIAWMLGTGLSEGVPGVGYQPEGVVTRAQAATFLWRYAGSPKTGRHSFADVPLDAYYDKPIAWMSAAGITTGYSATVYGPEAGATRAEFITFLWRLKGRPQVSSRSSYSDVARPSFYAPAVDWVVASGAMRPSARLEPATPLTRRELAVLLWRVAGTPSLYDDVR